MTTAIIHFPIKFTKSIRKALTYKNPRQLGKLRGKTVRLRYPMGSKTYSVTVIPEKKELQVRASVFKAISGQNAITLPNFPKSVRLAFMSIKAAMEKEFSCQFALDMEREITLSQVDLVRHYSVGTDKDVTSLIACVIDCIKSQGRYLQKPVIRGGTYESVKIELPDLGMSVQFYDKYLELQSSGHRLPRKIADPKLLSQRVLGHVRMEITVKGKALKERGLEVLVNWTGGKRSEIFDDVMSALKLQGHFHMSINDKLIKKMGAHLIPTYLLWKLGLPHDHVSKQTRSRHRAQLRDKKFNIDIDSAPDKDGSSICRLDEIFVNARRFKPTNQDIKKWIPAWANKN